MLFCNNPHYLISKNECTLSTKTFTFTLSVTLKRLKSDMRQKHLHILKIKCIQCSRVFVNALMCWLNVQDLLLLCCRHQQSVCDVMQDDDDKTSSFLLPLWWGKWIYINVSKGSFIQDISVECDDSPFLCRIIAATYVKHVAYLWKRSY